MSGNKNDIRFGDTIAGRDQDGNFVTGEFMSVRVQQGPRFEAEGTAMNVAVVRTPNGGTAHIDRARSNPVKVIK